MFIPMLFQGFHPTTTTTNATSFSEQSNFCKSLYLRAACTKDESDEDDEEDEDGDDCHEDPNQRSHLEIKMCELKNYSVRKFV